MEQDDKTKFYGPRQYSILDSKEGQVLDKWITPLEGSGVVL
jgi:hypothetical protein